MRIGHFGAPITLVVGQSLRHGPQHPPPPPPANQADEGGGRRVWSEPFGTPGSWASTLPWPSAPNPSLTCPGRAGGPEGEGWAPPAQVVPRPRSLWGSGSSRVEGLTLFVSWGVWELGLAGVLGGEEHAGWGDGKGRCAWGNWRFLGVHHQHKLNRFDADALVRARASASDSSHLLV